MIDPADSTSVDDVSHVYTADPVLQLNDVHKSFGSLKVLDGLNIAVYPGEVFGFLGRNGAGKSTAIRLLMGITQCDTGHINVFGKPLKDDLIGIRQKVGYVAQDQNMYPWMTPKVLSKFVKSFYPAWDEKRYQQLINDFELPPKRRIGTFSGGMKAKLALTLALATRPQLLILDEPTAGMDPVARREFLDLVREQTVNDGSTTFFSTHLIDEIEAIADRIGIVESGKAIYDGALDPLRNSINSWSIPKEHYVAGDLPGQFALNRLKVLKEGERQGRWVITLQFSEDALASTEIVLNEGWRNEPMSLEDVFIAVVARP
ncbi:ABC transporter ATP-binding protein [Granulosicoccus sp.]|jgi:ABC-2 type transport system ATP-binding protein|nr:ABC transporter ATP-binding protein [Granulosicoccus sp.]MDB4222566.1 ABC transporter ATP-binding protein [Granulosicoccus sp.]